MEQERLEHYRTILLEQLRHHEEQVRDNQQAALEVMTSDDGVKDSVDMSLQDVNQEIAFRLGERESQMVADIDQALMRIDEGSYGTLRALRQRHPRAPPRRAPPRRATMRNVRRSSKRARARTSTRRCKSKEKTGKRQR
jgi:RNA polymerase-binding transcription factor DksA